MTVRVTTISGGIGTGASVGMYYDQVIERQKDATVERALAGGVAVDSSVGVYYESASGAFWMGASAERLGLSGVPGRADISRLVDGVDAEGVQLGRKFGEASARAFDVTFSVQKEVSILWAAADAPTRRVIEQAVVDAAVAVLDDQVGARAATRMRTGDDGEFLAADGKPVMVPAEGPAVAVIPEFTSRKGDPQLHVHGLVSSKVWEPTTERWLALEARELKQDQRALSGMFHAGLETGLSQELGVTWGARSYKYARTINGIDDGLIDVFSQRRADVDTRLAEKLERFETELGHAPSPQQRWRLEREAAVDSRPDKSAEHLDFDGWHQTIHSHTGRTAADLVVDVTGATKHLAHTVTQSQVDEMVAATIGELSDTKSSWTRGDFKAEFARVLPPDLAMVPKDLVAFINTQTDVALDALLQVTPETVDRPLRRWTTSDVLSQETRILTHIDQATQPDIAPNEAVAGHAPEWLDSLQLAAAGRVASTSDFEVVVGLAGAGKTSMLTTATDTLQAQDRAVFGLTPSASAAQVLHNETGIATENVAKFVWEHTANNNNPSPQYRLPTGATLIVDEAGMVSTPHWETLTHLAAVNHWRIVAVGDPYQFSAVGRGGIFEHLTNTIPDHRISQLEQVHRFDADWEATASAGIRSGDTTALDPYFDNGRIHVVNKPGGPGDVIEQAVDHYMTVRATGTEVGMFAASNETVDDLNSEIQTRLATTSQLGDRINIKDQKLFVGDQIETRRNARHLETDQGQFVKNRDRWTITNTTTDGITVTGKTGTITLPHDYINKHVQLAYAQTSHASQGRTINGTAITVYDPEHAPIDRAGLYVPLTRGKQTNQLFIHADTPTIARQHLEDAINKRWIDTPAISHTQPPHTHTPTPQASIDAPQVEQLQLQLETAHQLLNQPKPQPPNSKPVPPDPHYHQDNNESDLVPGKAEQVPVTQEPRSLLDDPEHLAPITPEPAPTPSQGQPLPPEPAPDMYSLEIEAGRVGSWKHISGLFKERLEMQEVASTSNFWIERTPSELDQINNEYEQLSIERNNYADQFNDLSTQSNKLVGRGARATEMETLETRIADIDEKRNVLKTSYEQLETNLPVHHQNLATATSRLETVEQQIRDDQTVLGTVHATHPAVTKKLGTPPNPSEGWFQAAGAVFQHHTANQQPETLDSNQQHTEYQIRQQIRHNANAQTKQINPPAPQLGRGLSL